MAIQIIDSQHLDEALSLAKRSIERLDQRFATFYRNSSGLLADHQADFPLCEFEPAQLRHFSLKSLNKLIRFTYAPVEADGRFKGRVDVHLIAPDHAHFRNTPLGGFTFSTDHETDVTQAGEPGHLQFATPEDSAAIVKHFILKALQSDYTRND